MSLKNQPGADEEEIKVSKSLLCLCRIHERFYPKKLRGRKTCGVFLFIFCLLVCLVLEICYLIEKSMIFFCGPNPYMIVLPEICLFFPQIKILKNIEAP